MGFFQNIQNLLRSASWTLIAVQFCILHWPHTAIADVSIVSIEIRYLAPAAGEVEFVWGINGWQTLDEAYRPSGTSIRNRVMSIPMTRIDKEFVVTVPALKDSSVEFGFLITKSAGGAYLQVWDGDHHIIASGPQTVQMHPKSMYHFAGVLVDRDGIIGLLVLGVEMTLLVLLGLRGLSLTKQPAIHSFQPNLQFALIMASIAGLLGFIVILHHEMWRDELQAWRIATSSTSFKELFANSRHEGHPAIWYIALYGLSRWSDHPLVMQLFHLAIGTASIFVLCCYSPFRKWQRICLSFGYFMFFEYYVISRNYALGVLALWSFCAIRTHYPNEVLLSVVMLGVLANTSAFGAVIAVGLGMWVLFEDLGKPDRTTRNSIFTVAILSGALYLANSHSSPSADNSPRILAWNTALLGTYVERTLGSVWSSYVPIPSNIPNFWNTNILGRLGTIGIGNIIFESRDVAAILSYVFIGASSLLFIRHSPLLLVYVGTTAMLLFFLHTKANHGIRHTGHLFLLFVACSWLSQATRGLHDKAATSGMGPLFISVLLAIQPVAGVLCAVTDFVYPFSASKATADFIMRNNLESTKLVGSKYNVVSPVACYLNQPVLYLENGQTGTFVNWSKPRTKLSPVAIVQKAKEVNEFESGDVLLISSYDLENLGLGTKKIASFERSIVDDERYWLYLLPGH